MEFEKGNLYHIYNQGNNRRKIFFKRNNYIFFLEKLRTYVLPYADILAWCLMTNHFHLMVRVNEVELAKSSNGSLVSIKSSDDSQGRATETSDDSLDRTAESSDGSQGRATKSSNGSQAPTAKSSTRTLNYSIAILLRSYASAINKQEKTSGSLFKTRTKAECISCINGLKPSFYTEDGVTKINIQNPENQYPQNCFNYIHLNPVKANLVKTAADWEYSSAKEFAGLRNGNLVNKKVALEFVDLQSGIF